MQWLTGADAPSSTATPAPPTECTSLARRAAAIEAQMARLRPTSTPEAGALARLAAELAEIQARQQELGCFQPESRPGTIPFGVYGADLGYSVPTKAGGTAFYFGDTAIGRTAPTLPSPLGDPIFGDKTFFRAVGFSNAQRPGDLSLHFAPNPGTPPPLFAPLEVDGFLTLNELPNRVPTGTCALPGQPPFVFLTVDDQIGISAIFSVVAWSSAGSREHLDRFYVLSRGGDAGGGKFLNVSAIPIDNASVPGLPSTSGPGVLLFGSGYWGQSDLYLAWLPAERLGQIVDPIVDPPKSGFQYWGHGREGGLLVEPHPLAGWRSSESWASPLLGDTTLQIPTVTYNRFLKKWIVLSVSAGAPDGLSLRSADLPMGPWSEVTTVPLDAYRYAPAVIDHFTEGEEGSWSTLYMVVSFGGKTYNARLVRLTLTLS
jgi:hypothetical protein